MTLFALAGAFPPAGIVIELRDLHEAELLVVIGTWARVFKPNGSAVPK
jgi:hypothetical protein